MREAVHAIGARGKVGKERVYERLKLELELVKAQRRALESCYSSDTEFEEAAEK